jgi:hypothetical protein
VSDDTSETQGRPPPEEREPTVPAVTEDRVGVLAAYVRTNRDRFTDEALRASAQKAGYTDTEIAAAWKAAVDRGALSTEHRTNAGVVILVAIGFVVLLYGGGTAIATVGLGDIAAFVAIGIVVAGLAGWVLLRETRPSLSSGLGWGVLLAVGLPLILILGVLGICVVFGAFAPPIVGP